MADQGHMWDAQDGETTKSYRAFIIYRDQGPSRSMSRTASELIERGIYTSKSVSIVGQLKRWSHTHKWVARAKAYDNWLDTQARESFADEIRKKAQRQADHAFAHQFAASRVATAIVRRYDHDPQAFMDELSDLPIVELLALEAKLTGPWVQAMQAERLALGMSTENTAQVEAPTGVDPTPEQTGDEFQHVTEVVAAIEQAIGDKRG